MVSSIQSISQEAEVLHPVFPWSPSEIHWKPEGMYPKNFDLVLIQKAEDYIAHLKEQHQQHLLEAASKQQSTF